MNGELLNAGGLHLDGLVIPYVVLTTLALTAFIVVTSSFLTCRLKNEPSRGQLIVEGVIVTMHDAVKAVVPNQADCIFPFIATLWLFVLSANLCGVIPFVHSPTTSLSTTSALAILVCLSVHWFGIKAQGLKSYLSHYLKPSPILLPFHIISEISRTIALAVRLFGNMMSLDMAAMMILLVAGFLVPVPLLMLHVVEAVVQAYIFGMLALIYIASSLQTQQQTQNTGVAHE